MAILLKDSLLKSTLLGLRRVCHNQQKSPLAWAFCRLIGCVWRLSLHVGINLKWTGLDLRICEVTRPDKCITPRPILSFEVLQSLTQLTNLLTFDCDLFDHLLQRSGARGCPGSAGHFAGSLHWFDRSDDRAWTEPWVAAYGCLGGRAIRA